jgi:Protein of unknown function (DUF3553)
MPDGLGPGVHVRHRKRPEWGIGRVNAREQGDGHVVLVIDFEHEGEKKLHFVEELFEQVPSHEIEAWQEARRKAEEAQKKAVRRAARAKALKTTTLSPAAIVECGWGRVEPTGAGSVVASVSSRVRFFDAGGGLLDEIAVDWPGSDDLTVHGDFIVGRRTHDWENLLLCRPRERRAQVWRCPIKLGVRRVAAAREDEIVLWDREKLVLVDAEGGSRQVPFALGGAHISTVCVWGDALLVGTAGPDAPGSGSYFHFVCVDFDGAVRWRRVGYAPTPLSADVAVAIDRGVVVVAPDGSLVSEAESPRPSGGVSVDKAPRPFVAIDDDAIFCSERRVVRYRTQDGTVLWSTGVSALSGLEPPVLAGPAVGATTSVHGEGKTVWIVDAASGRVLVADDAATKVSELCAVGPDALVACSYSKKLVGWRKLASSPERLALPHLDKVFEACSPAPGALVARTGSHLTFWRL